MAGLPLNLKQARPHSRLLLGGAGHRAPPGSVDRVPGTLASRYDELIVDQTSFFGAITLNLVRLGDMEEMEVTGTPALRLGTGTSPREVA